MSARSNGGIVGPRLSSTVTSASGVWNLGSAYVARRRSAWPGLDAFFGNVSLLLLGETDADSSSNAFTITKVGNAATSTTQVKYGSRSWAFDGTGDYLTVPANSVFDFGTGDFTIEAWVYIAGNTALSGESTRPIVVFGLYNGSTVAFEFLIRGSSTTTGTGLRLYRSTNTTTDHPVDVSISQNTWHHIAVSRSSGTVRFFLNGTQEGNNITSTGIWGSSSHTAYVAGWTISNYLYHMNGYIDELRVTKGVARYTANFTPPSSFG